MKKVLLLLLVMAFAVSSGAFAKGKVKKDVLKDKEYKELKTAFFEADGVGSTYECKVEQQRFRRIKDLDTGLYVLCDRDVSRTQWESAKVFYKYGRCIKLN